MNDPQLDFAILIACCIVVIMCVALLMHVLPL